MQKFHGKASSKLFNLEKEEEDPEKDPIYHDIDMAAENVLEEQENHYETSLYNMEKEKEETRTEEKLTVKTPIRVNGVDGVALVDSGAVGAFIQDTFLEKIGIELRNLSEKTVKRGGIE
jgi:hypothetical protein